VGYAIVLETYSSFLARPTLYLEDIFVRPEARCRGAGSALFAHLAQEARARGCGRMEWVVLDWNELAQRFYQKRGARRLNDWQYYRLDAAGIARLNNTSHSEVTGAPTGLEKETNET
jgi:GNAT superfamily N-acetyltransferase